MLPLVTIITPIFLEAEEIVGFSIHDPEDMQRAGRLILKEFGPQSVVIKVVILKVGARISSLPVEEHCLGKSTNSNLSHPW